MKNINRSHYHCVFNLNYHLVLVTKYRRRCFTKLMRERLFEISQTICSRWDIELKEFGGESDHIHLLVSCHTSMQLSKFVNNLKTVTSRLIRKEFSDELKKYYWRPVLWTRAYCIVSVGGAPLEIIKRYINDQGKESSPEGDQFISTQIKLNT